MWSTFFVPEEEGRTVGPPPAPQGVAPAGLGVLMAARGKRRRQGGGGGPAGHPLSEALEGKIKLVFSMVVVGVVLAVLGAGTEFWAELSPPKTFFNNETCLMAHFGLWKACTRTLRVADVPPDRTSCGPAELPGESVCSYFKFFTTGENAVIFHKTTQRGLNVAAAMLALFSLFLTVVGSVCTTLALSRELLSFLKPASFCFSLAGVLILVSLLVFHQSVQVLLASDPAVPVHHHLSWSVAVLGCAGGMLLAGGLLFLLLALPCGAQHPCLWHRDSGH